MPYKLCPSCEQASYSAASGGTWICPYCGKELTLQKAIQDRRQLPQPGEQQSTAHGKLHLLPRL